MFRTLTRRLHRSRRRFAIAAVFLFAAGFITFMGVRSGDFGALMPVIAGLAYLVVFLPLGVLMALVLPPLRSAVEVVSFALLFVAILGRVTPEVSMLDMTTTHTIWFIIGTSFLSQLYGGRMLDKRFTLDEMRTTIRARSRLDAKTLYDGLVGNPDRPQALAEADILISYDRLPDDPNTHRIIEKLPQIGRIEELHHIRAEDAPWMRDFDWEPVDVGHEAGFSGGHTRFEIEDRGRYRLIIKRDTVRPFPSRAALFGWIDDFNGRFLDDRITVLEKRAKSAPSPDATPLPA